MLSNEHQPKLTSIFSQNNIDNKPDLRLYLNKTAARLPPPDVRKSIGGCGLSGSRQCAEMWPFYRHQLPCRTTPGNTLSVAINSADLMLIT